MAVAESKRGFKNIGNLVAEYFDVKERGGWNSFRHPLAQERFGSPRAGKFMISGRVPFTFGETEQGKRQGISHRLVELIQAAGLLVVREHSTSGQRRNSSEYVGFESSRASEQQVRLVLKKVADLIESSVA